MRVMVFIKASESTEAALPPTPEAFEAMERFTEELVEAGVLLAGAGLKPTAEARRIVCDGPVRAVSRGPFPGPGEVVAGFSIWQVADMDEAVAWASRCPNPMPGRCQIELRPFLEASDMAALLDQDARRRLGVA